MRTPQQKARDWLSTLSQGLGIALGTCGTLYELFYDERRNWQIILIFLAAAGIRVGAEPTWALLAAWLSKASRVTLSVGTVRLEVMRDTTVETKPLSLPATIAIPLETERTAVEKPTPSSEKSRPKPPSADERPTSSSP